MRPITARRRPWTRATFGADGHSLKPLVIAGADDPLRYVLPLTQVAADHNSGFAYPYGAPDSLPEEITLEAERAVNHARASTRAPPGLARDALRLCLVLAVFACLWTCRDAAAHNTQLSSSKLELTGRTAVASVEMNGLDVQVALGETVLAPDNCGSTAPRSLARCTIG
jgi:hypothetical protein